jgi:hypothetical protein
MKEKKKKQFKYFEYKDVDYFTAPSDWLFVKLSNRLKDGYEIWRDKKNISWKGILKLKNKE